MDSTVLQQQQAHPPPSDCLSHCLRVECISRGLPLVCGSSVIGNQSLFFPLLTSASGDVMERSDPFRAKARCGV